jgi:hypothetical protein
MKPEPIICRYCNNNIPDDAAAALVKEPHREPMPAHLKCGERAVEDGRGRVHLYPKTVKSGFLEDVDIEGWPM